MSLSLILLLFLSNMHTLLCFPVGTTTNEDIMTESPNEFMKILYKCWSLKDDDDYKKCLEAMGEGDRVGEIMNANEVTGLIGNFVESKGDGDRSDAIDYVPIFFNFSSINSNGGAVKFSELRIFRERISTSTQGSNDLCNFTEGINITLIAQTSENGQLYAVEKQLIGEEKLMENQWIVFSHIDSLIKQWQQVDTNNKKDSRMMYIAVEGNCGSLNPTSVGINTVPHKLPLLAVFLDNTDNMKDTQKIIESTTITRQSTITTNQRKRRATANNVLCELVNFTVNFTDLGWDKFIKGPASYEANYCSGLCQYPLSSKQNGTFHSQIQSFYNLRDPENVPKVCCTPTKLISLAVLMEPDSRTLQIKYFPNMTATECGCR